VGNGALRTHHMIDVRFYEARRCCAVSCGLVMDDVCVGFGFGKVDVCVPFIGYD
jgi:hypothetical protein